MFQPGDIVQLKSGGPAMTVRWCRAQKGDEIVTFCNWFDEADEKGYGFLPSQLQKIATTSDVQD